MNHYKEEEETFNKTLNITPENNVEMKNEESEKNNENENQGLSLSEGKPFQIVSTIKPSLIQRSCLKQMQVQNLPKVYMILLIDFENPNFPSILTIIFFRFFQKN